MASKYKCICGKVIYTNLFSGNKMSLLISERVVDIDEADSEKTVSDLLDEIVFKSEIVTQCPDCSRLSIIDKDYNIRLFEPISQS